MDGAVFKQTLSELGHTQVSFSRAYRVSVRTVENWARNGPPEFVAHILAEMKGLSVDSPSDGRDATAHNDKLAVARALDASLSAVLERGIRAGWTREMIAAGAIDWFVDQITGKRQNS